MVVLNSFNFCLSLKVLISPSNLNNDSKACELCFNKAAVKQTPLRPQAGPRMEGVCYEQNTEAPVSTKAAPWTPWWAAPWTPWWAARGRPGGLGTQRWAVPPGVAQAAEEGGFLNWRKNQTRFPSRDKLF